MRKLIDRTGKKYHELTVIRFLRAGGQGIGAVWECRCDCGKLTECNSGELVSGHKKSCGCRKIRVATQRVYRHGLARHPLYLTWFGMIARCNDPKSISYPRYGGRGISVCKRWTGNHGLRNFISDMGSRPDGMTLDRKNNDGNYTPKNCRWATPKGQGANRKNNRLVSFRGETNPTSVWAERLGISRSSMLARLKSGWTIERALTEKPSQDRLPKRIRSGVS